MENLLPTLIPRLENSYIVVNRLTGQSVFEVYKDSKLINLFNYNNYKLVPVSLYLAGLNHGITE